MGAKNRTCEYGGESKGDQGSLGSVVNLGREQSFREFCGGLGVCFGEERGILWGLGKIIVEKVCYVLIYR